MGFPVQGPGSRRIVDEVQHSERPRPLKQLDIAARPTLLFVVAYALNTTPHEFTHAFAAWLLGFNATVYQMWVNPDSAAATPGQLATIAAVGPVFSLSFGVICLLFYGARWRTRHAGLLFLMLALVGIDCFLGPIAGAGFGGDFHAALVDLGAPGWVGIAVSMMGWALLAAFMFCMGWELEGWVPRDFGWIGSVVCSTAAPALVGSLLILVLYWPLPRVLVQSTLDGSMLWTFAVMGAAVAFKASGARRPISGVTGVDAAVAIAAMVMVRAFAGGIRLAH